jgi:membrane-associated protein
VPSAVELLTFAEDLINKWGIYIIPIGAFLENSVILGFIFPGTTIIFLSGFVARTAGSDLWVVILLATAGSFLGDNLDYLIGRRVGRILENKPLFAKPIGIVEPLLKKYGVWAIFAGRFSAWSRAWVALASGITRFKYLFFALASALSALVWTSVWVIGGYLVGGNRELISQWLTRASLVVWAGLAVLAVYYFRTRLKLIFDLAMFLSKKYSGKIKNGFGNNSRI